MYYTGLMSTDQGLKFHHYHINESYIFDPIQEFMKDATLWIPCELQIELGDIGHWSL